MMHGVVRSWEMVEMAVDRRTMTSVSCRIRETVVACYCTYKLISSYNVYFINLKRDENRQCVQHTQ